MTRFLVSTSLATSVLFLSCVTEPLEDQSLAQEVSNPCKNRFKDVSGRTKKTAPTDLGDAFAEKVMKTGANCPVTFSEIMDKLRETDADAQNCKADNARGGILTRVISETAAALDKPTNYRTVTSRTCNGRQRFEFLFSSSSRKQGNGFAAPSDFVEVIAMDKAAGVFNYYEANGDEITFFGSSIDFVTKPLVEDGETRKCGRCHTGGGLVMKELPTPWLHWDSSHMSLPGASDMVAQIEDFGEFGGGAEMEGMTIAGNREWNKARLNLFKNDGNVKELLRPLFCDTEVNLNNGTGFPGDEITQISAKMLNDLSRFGATPKFTNADYIAQLKENGQRMDGLDGKQIDTHIPLVFVERSGADRDFVSKLQSEKIVDAEFINDVLLVDFTRPIFSSDRCGLLKHAPTLAAAAINPENIKKGFQDSLANANEPAAAELLRNLTNDKDDGNTMASNFVKECSKREAKGFLKDALEIVSLNRTLGRKGVVEADRKVAQHVFEFAATMPVDELAVDKNARLDPNDCTLVKTFKSAKVVEQQ